MQSAVVFPIHDPEGTIFPHLKVILPDLKLLFVRAYIGITSVTSERCRDQVHVLADDDFFSVLHNPQETSVGEQFRRLYQQAACAAPSDQILHLCFVDRLAFILQSGHQRQFIEDIGSIKREDTPIIFSRSATAWDSHPRNYYENEQFATTVGEWLFGRQLDFAWCYLAICASQLREILPQVNNRDLSVLAEITLAIRENVRMQAVEWLAWEDPFLLNCAEQALKNARESSVQETEKRLAYVIPTIQTLMRSVRR